MYKTELSELRRQIDSLDNEIIDKIFKLSQVTKSFKQKINHGTRYTPLVTLDIARLARDKNLDEKAVLKIFKEIMLLIDEQEANLK
jgi:chorismate mutase